MTAVFVAMLCLATKPTLHGYLYQGNSSPDFVVLVQDNGKDESVYRPVMRCHHADDPGTPLTIDACLGREALVTPPDFENAPSGVMVYGTIVIVGGIPPARYAAAVAAAYTAPPDPLLWTVVVRGLGGGLQTGREAAQTYLIRKGAAAIPALVRGLSYRDAEVRWRAQCALMVIRKGVWAADHRPADDEDA